MKRLTFLCFFASFHFATEPNHVISEAEFRTPSYRWIFSSLFHIRTHFACSHNHRMAAVATATNLVCHHVNGFCSCRETVTSNKKKIEIITVAVFLCCSLILTFNVYSFAVKKKFTFFVEHI